MPGNTDKTFAEKLEQYAKSAFRGGKTMKAVNYAAAAGAIAALPSVCLAEIQPSGPRGTVVNMNYSGDNTAKLDIDGDGVDDFYMAAGTWTGGGGTATRFIWLQQENAYGAVLGTTGSYWGRAFSKSTYITPAANSEWNPYGSLAAIYNSSTVRGNFAGRGNKYLGVRFRAGDGQIHYGWVQVNVPANASSVTIVNWAYEDQPNAPIGAGHLPVTVPTLNEWGMTVFMLILCALALRMMKKKEETAA